MQLRKLQLSQVVSLLAVTSGIYPLLMKNCEPATGSIWKQTGVKKDLSFRYFKSSLFKQGCISGQHLFWTISISSESFLQAEPVCNIAVAPTQVSKAEPDVVQGKLAYLFPPGLQGGMYLSSEKCTSKAADNQHSCPVRRRRQTQCYWHFQSERTGWGFGWDLPAVLWSVNEGGMGCRSVSCIN